jgi:hypothetical protein
VDRAPQVDSERPAPVVERHLADRRPTGADAGVVDHQGRRPAEPLRGPGGELFDIGYRRDVAVHRDGVAALVGDRVDGALGGGLVDVGAHHPPAPVGQFDR